MASARIEDPAGGESLTPRREDFEGGTGAGGAVGLDHVPGAEGLPALQGASTAFAGARFDEAVVIGGGAGWSTLARLGFCGVTAVSTSEGRGRMAAGTGGGAVAGVGGGGPDDAMT
jgi:hypothetical protein